MLNSLQLRWQPDAATSVAGLDFKKMQPEVNIPASTIKAR
jgi:hypothetical protein